MSDNSQDLANNDEQLRKMFMDSSNLGTENIGRGIPVLKIYQKNVTPADNVLEDGSEPTDGYFYHKALGVQFDTVMCHMLVISRGYWSWTPKDKEGKTRVRFGQIVGGMITNDGINAPFLMYIHGIKWPYLRDFSKEVSRYTKRKNNPLPLFSMITQMHKANVKTNNGIKYAPEYMLVRNDSGEPEYIKDVAMVKILMDLTYRLKDEISDIIRSKEVTQDGEPVINDEELPISSQSVENSKNSEPVMPENGNMPNGSKPEVVDPDDLPF